MTKHNSRGDRPPAGRSEDNTPVTDLDFSGADVVIVESPDGKRTVVKGGDIVDAASDDASARPVPETVRVMTVRCDRWSEVALILSRMGH